MNRRRFLLGGMAALALPSCSQPVADPLRLGASIWPGFEPLFLARHLGKLDPAVIQLAEYPTASELMLSFQHRALDAITVSVDDVLRLASYGHDVRIVKVLSYSEGGDALLAQKEFPTMDSLRGKTVGFEVNSLGSYMLAKALAHHGMKAADLVLRPWRADRLNRQFRINAVDAVVTYEPFRGQLAESGANVIFDSNQIPGEIVNFLVVRHEALASQSSALLAVSNAWDAGLQFLKDHPQIAAEAVASRERTTPQALLRSLDLLRFVDAGEHGRLFAPGNTELYDLLVRTSEFMFRFDLLPRPVKVTDLRHSLVASPVQ